MDKPPIYDTLVYLRSKYGPEMNNDECVALCNDAAYIHRNDPEKWGLSFKSGGTYGTRKDGVTCAHDIIMNGITNEGFDVLAGAGAESTPIWGSVGIITDPNRYWVAPISSGVVVTPPPLQPKIKSREQFGTEFTQVNNFYAAEEGLQRPGGMVLNGQADIVAMIQWGYDLMTGRTVEQVINEIKQSHEYKTKHS